MVGSLKFGVQVNAERALKSMGRYIKWANVTVPRLTEKQANEGALFAVSVAPRSRTGHGALVQAIDAQKSSRGVSWEIVSRTPKNQTDIRGKSTSRQVPYQSYLAFGKHGFLQGKKFTPTGKYNYMELTAERLRKKYPGLIKDSLNKIK